MSVVRLHVLGDCVIEVDESLVDPGSTHLFALLLILGLESERRVHRSELHKLLFSGDIEPRQASHNLRQLLYRVRRLGVQLDETPTGMRLRAGTSTGIGYQLSLLVGGECDSISAASLAFLPAYAPRMPQAYLEWLDRQRDIADSIVRKGLRAACSRFRDSHAWESAVRAGSTLLAVDPLSAEAVTVMAEALAMLGRREEALSLLDSFGSPEDTAKRSIDALRPLRARIGRMGDVKKQLTLRGRDDCLRSLEAEWDKLASDGGRRAVLIGHAGIGKTRVAEAFSARIALLGAHVTRYTCDAASSEQPLGLFSDILPELRRLRGSIGASPHFASALDRLRPVVAPSDRPPSSDVSVEAVRAEVQRALIDLLEAVSDEKPLLLLVDDAHYLDATSANVIQALSGKSNTARVLVVLCVRPSHADQPLIEPARRGVSIVLDPLPPDVSRQVVLDVAGEEIAESHLQWCLQQSAGNPFFLHTLASQRLVSATLVPFDIRSLASNAYSSLSTPTRSVLESCLLLGRLATLSRVTRVSGVSDKELLSALRDLETLDLLKYSNGTLAGPHALLHDALASLVPSAVAALLHTRIAKTLEEECEAEQYGFPVAWAAAQSWLAAGDPHAAARMVRKCALQAALIGETKIAIDLLSRVADASLPAVLHATLLDELVAYAEASASPMVIASAASTRFKLAEALGDDRPNLREFERRMVDANVVTGGPTPEAINLLLNFLADESATPYTRAHAAARLLIIADQDLDTRLAERVFACLPSISRKQSEIKTVCECAELVFHTFCGDRYFALQLSLDLLHQFPHASPKRESIKARANAAFALHRLRDDRAAEIFAETYDSMLKHGILKRALYAASVRTSIAIALGDFASAKEWLAKSKLVLRGEESHVLSPESGLYADEALLLMREGRYDDAQPLIFFPAKDFAMLSSARHKAVSLALWVRLKQLRGDTDPFGAEVHVLSELYARGKSLGGQDTIVEALWSAHTLAGDASSASNLLADYLKSRREIGNPEWSLSHTTAGDEAWSLT